MKVIINNDALDWQIEFSKRHHENNVKMVDSIIKPSLKKYEAKISDVVICYPEEYNAQINGHNGAVVLIDCKEWRISARTVTEEKFVVLTEKGNKYFSEAIEEAFESYF